MNKKKKSIIILVILIGIFSVLLGLLVTGVLNINKNEEITENEPIEEIKNVQPERSLWLSNKDINDDYIGELVFDSNLINVSFVQAKNTVDSNGELYRFYTETGKIVSDTSEYCGNDVYIYTNWKDFSYDFKDNGGSIFMDYRNELIDQNIIIYGHHFSIAAGYDVERIKAFTPLEKLLEKDNYQDNSTCKLILDNETRYYELASVYIFDLDNQSLCDNMQYFRPTYNYDDFAEVTDNDYYKNYISYLNSVELYETGVELTTNDKTLTLQTCIGGKPNQREICVFRLVKTDYFED